MQTWRRIGVSLELGTRTITDLPGLGQSFSVVQVAERDERLVSLGRLISWTSPETVANSL